MQQLTLFDDMDISFGIPALDAMIGSAKPGEISLLAGHGGTGKTFMGLQLAMNMAQSGYSTVYVSVEQSRASLYLRALQIALGLDRNTIEHMVELDHPDLKKASDFYSKLVITDTATTVQEIQQIVTDHHAKVLIIDPIDLIGNDPRNTAHEISKLAHAHDLYALCLQNSPRTAPQGQAPQSLSNTHVADRVFGIWRSIRSFRSQSTEEIGVKVLKNRTGPSGDEFRLKQDARTGKLGQASGTS